MFNKNKISNSILIIEDDLVLNHQLKQLLEKQRFIVSQCFDGEHGLLAAVSEHYDLILLDISLPERDGYSVLNTLRQTRKTPVIILTAHGAEEERILGFKNGADDYLPKPFNFTELVLRIEAILRRACTTSYQQLNGSVLQHEGLTLDRQKQQVFFHEHAVQLTPIQFKLLWTLMQHANHLLSKPQLYRLVMERDFSRYDRSLDMHMSRVRRKLIDVGMPVDRLQTVHGAGYILL
ncbi:MULTISPECIES: response regulator transcription factor [unclassified Methylophaga]|jgi:two-component system, OmpR family, response regulator PfeR|uniref:response regulator transcription factor n=1 Tax=unclassified Methylophaga TaxID=2629249 RepID=UPI000C3FEC14|nr:MULTISPECIES: response regulator transcription factor [unclassified Methylophaga]MAL48933.1 DNA-binding response regulator [Methylophaga sp.]MBP26214.1 DNA-binding response regulator [Methylophaga sp.]|tara:strand:+ start:3529 stop:4233 length:705 start_codon:yes stop_codon:yes gene_type:complete